MKLNIIKSGDADVIYAQKLDTFGGAYHFNVSTYFIGLCLRATALILGSIVQSEMNQHCYSVAEVLKRSVVALALSFGMGENI